MTVVLVCVFFVNDEVCSVNCFSGISLYVIGEHDEQMMFESEYLFVLFAKRCLSSC